MYCYENANNEALPLEFRFSYHPETPHSLLHEDTEGRTDRICDFYKKLWVGKTYKTPVLPAGRQTYKANGGELVISQDLIEKFMSTIGGGMRRMDHEGFAPMDFAIVVGWKAIMKAIFAASIDGDLLKLVHSPMASVSCLLHTPSDTYQAILDFLLSVLMPVQASITIKFDFPIPSKA